jgi:hypothetical protein
MSGKLTALMYSAYTIRHAVTLKWLPIVFMRPINGYGKIQYVYSTAMNFMYFFPLIRNPLKKEEHTLQLNARARKPTPKAWLSSVVAETPFLDKQQVTRWPTLEKNHHQSIAKDNCN